MAQTNLGNALCTENAEIPALLGQLGLLEFDESLEYDSEDIWADKHLPDLVLGLGLEHLLDVLNSEVLDVVVSLAEEVYMFLQIPGDVLLAAVELALYELYCRLDLWVPV